LSRNRAVLAARVSHPGNRCEEAEESDQQEPDNTEETNPRQSLAKAADEACVGITQSRVLPAG
jgi:hypothetical protein